MEANLHAAVENAKHALEAQNARRLRGALVRLILEAEKTPAVYVHLTGEQDDIEHVAVSATPPEGKQLSYGERVYRVTVDEPGEVGVMNFIADGGH